MNLYAFAQYFTIVAAGVNQDLFSSEWTEGNLYSIQPVVSKVGGFACKVISFVGFMIVIASILKNAISGLYVVNPNLWDKVDQMKKAGQDLAANANFGNSKFGAAAAKGTSFLSHLIGWLPNVKELTDFEDNEIDKKQYFMKSIPLLVAQIFIGMMIFFGYPAKIANWIGSAGTQVLSGIINNVDPVATVTSLSKNFAVVSLSTDGSTDPVDMIVNKMAIEGTRVVQTKYSDMNEGPRQNVASQIELQVSDFCRYDKLDELVRSPGYSTTTTVSWSTAAPTVSSGFQSYNITDGQDGKIYQAMSTSGVYAFRFWISATNLPSGSTKVGDTDYLVFGVQCTPQALSNTSTASLIALGNIGTTGHTTKVSGVSTTTYLTGIDIGNEQDRLNLSLGKSIQATFMKKTADGFEQGRVFNVSLQASSASTSSGTLNIVVGSADKTDFDTALTEIGSTGYISLPVSGVNASITTVSTGNNGGGEVTARVGEIRLYPGNTTKCEYVNGGDGDSLLAGKASTSSIYEAITWKQGAGQTN